MDKEIKQLRPFKIKPTTQLGVEKVKMFPEAAACLYWLL